MKAQLVLYDEDCGICTAFAMRVEQRGVPVAAIGSPQGERWLHDLTPAERYSSFHAIDELGDRHSSGAAVPVVARALPGGRPLAAIAAAFPRLTEALYVRFARNRHRISAVLGTRACGATRVSRERPD
jgi:predicted DCC family thiol-disulfide oxidoreductase YuxK